MGNFSPRIHGGKDVIPYSWPWIVNIAFDNFLCGGTIVDDETIVSAAHCCDGFQRRADKVRLTISDHFFHQKGARIELLKTSAGIFTLLFLVI